MAKKKRYWFLNILIVLTIIVCLLAFAAHYKNWTRTEVNKMTILSGIYMHDVEFDNLEQVAWVEKLPPMVRLNGFSAFEKGKGVYQQFQDTLTDKKVYVFIDNFENQKIHLKNKDSSHVFFNLKDSLETIKMFDFLNEQIKKEN